MLTDVDKFKEYLNANSLKQTTERIDIATAVTTFEDIFTIDELMDRIIDHGWPVSKATLYRSIPLLIESGMIKPIATHKLNNHTFKRCDGGAGSGQELDCDKCGNSVSLNDNLIEDIYKTLFDKYEVSEIVENLLMLKGICPKCVESFKSIEKTDNSEFQANDFRILIFEDDELLRSFMSDYFETCGYDVITFSKASEFKNGCPCNDEPHITCSDIIITDIKMPEMTGIEFVREQISRNCNIKHIAFISAYWTIEDLDYAGSIGAAIFHKPFRINELNEWIKKCLPKIPNDRILKGEFQKEYSN